MRPSARPKHTEVGSPGRCSSIPTTPKPTSTSSKTRFCASTVSTPQRLIDGYVATLGGNQTCRFQVGYDFVWGSAAARERAMAVLDTVALNELCPGTASRAPARPRSHGADLCRRGGHRYPGAGSKVCDLAPASGSRPERPDHGGPTRALARLAAGPVPDTSLARWEIQLHLSGFPDSATARRAARVLAAQGAPTDYFWLGALAISDGRWTEAEAVRRALERQTKSVEADGSPRGSQCPRVRGGAGSLRGARQRQSRTAGGIRIGAGSASRVRL